MMNARLSWTVVLCVLVLVAGCGSASRQAGLAPGGSLGVDGRQPDDAMPAGGASIQALPGGLHAYAFDYRCRTSTADFGTSAYIDEIGSTGVTGFSITFLHDYNSAGQWVNFSSRTFTRNFGGDPDGQNHTWTQSHYINGGTIGFDYRTRVRFRWDRPSPQSDVVLTILVGTCFH